MWSVLRRVKPSPRLCGLTIFLNTMFILEMSDIFSTKAMRNSRYESIVQKVRHDSVSAPKGKNDFRIHVQPKSLQKGRFNLSCRKKYGHENCQNVMPCAKNMFTATCMHRGRIKKGTASHCQVASLRRVLTIFNNGDTQSSANKCKNGNIIQGMTVRTSPQLQNPLTIFVTYNHFHSHFYYE